MTFTAAAFVLLSLVASEARALQPASAADMKKIQELLNKADLIQADVKRMKNNLEAAEIALKRSPDDPDLKSQAAYVARTLNDFVRDRDLVRDKAIHRTLTAYGIVSTDRISGKPKMPSGIAVVPDYKGQAAHWRVVARDDDKRINLNLRGDRVHEGPVDNKLARASTDGSGITIVYEESFSSPEYLALILSHEKEHFEQYTTKGRGDKLSPNERELVAWRKTERDALILGFSANDPTINATGHSRFLRKESGQ